MPVHWNASLETGIDSIDEQHRAFFDQMNRMMEACDTAEGQEELQSLLAFLSEYVRKHFGMEEKFMASYSYPEYRPHCDLHRKFMRELVEFKGNFSKNASKASMLQMIRSTVDWLVNHIGVEDRKLGNFIIEKTSVSGVDVNLDAH